MSPARCSRSRRILNVPLAKPFVKIGRKTIGGLADFYAKDVPGIFASVKDQQAQRDFKAANDAAIRAIREFDSWLAEQETLATAEFALGAEKFAPDAQDDGRRGYSVGPLGSNWPAGFRAESGRTAPGVREVRAG